MRQRSLDNISSTSATPQEGKLLSENGRKATVAVMDLDRALMDGEGVDPESELEITLDNLRGILFRSNLFVLPSEVMPLILELFDSLRNGITQLTLQNSILLAVCVCRLNGCEKWNVVRLMNTKKDEQRAKMCHNCGMSNDQPFLAASSYRFQSFPRDTFCSTPPPWMKIAILDLQIDYLARCRLAKES